MRKCAKRIVALGLAALLAVSVAQPHNVMARDVFDTTAKIPAFPGAEGGGMYASGGRGYDVYIVTNLEDYGKNDTPIEGSLRFGLKSNTTIVFNVAGNIELKESLRFHDLQNITIAGQTAPGDGITISGWDTNISNSKNIIIRYMRFRPGAINVHTGGDSMDSLWGRDNDTFIIDHCSFSWNTDETLSIYRGENGTVQWNMVYESLTLSGHSKGRHGYGGIAGGDAVTFHHNLYANHTSRNPRMGGGYAGYADADHVAVTEMSNNVIYNWGFNTAYGGGYGYTNFRNNYELSGPGTRDNVVNWVMNPGEATKVGGFYINGNYIADFKNKENGILTHWLDHNSEYIQFGGVSEGENKTSFNEVPYVSADSTGVNHGISNEGFDSYELRDASTVFSEVIKKAGATYPHRDALDARIAAEVENGLGRYINTEHQVGGYLSPSGVITAMRDDDFDKDCDGMADAWEIENGLDPNDASDRNGFNLSLEGYTNLEVYLNSLVDMDHEPENPIATVVSPANNEFINEGDTVTVSVEAKSEYGHPIEKVDFYYSTEYETVFAGSVDVADSNGERSSAMVNITDEIPTTSTGSAVMNVATSSALKTDAIVTEGIFTMDISGLTDGSYYITARVYDTLGNQTHTTASEIHVNADATTLAGAEWMNVDVGNTAINGTGSFVDGVLTVKGNGKLGSSEGSVSGTDTSKANKDEFHYVYQEITGDVEVIAKIESISAVDNHAFAGIMIRNGLAEDSASAALGLSWVKYTNLPWSIFLAGRNTDGGNFDQISETIDSQANAERAGISLQADIPFKNGPNFVGYWMKLVRYGDKFTAYSSVDGEIWTKIGDRTIHMNESVYVGFAAESNKVANDIEQLNTARFSNIKVNTTFHEVKYNLTGLSTVEAPSKVADGEDLHFKITTEIGMQVPETVDVTINGDTKQVTVDVLDKLEGKVVVENVTGSVTITASAKDDSNAYEQVEYTVKDAGKLLSITWDKKAMILNQLAIDGQITQNVVAGSEKPAKNVSYILFPETTDAQKMELDITITSKVDTAASKGLFVGAFQADGSVENFASLGFRNTASQSLTAYWIKNTGSAGNGGSSVNNGSLNTKPSYKLGETYHVVFEKISNGLTQQYQVSYKGVDENGNEVDAYKLFKESESNLKSDSVVQYGLALIGVSAKVENLKLTDSRNRILYDQNAIILPDVVDKEGLLEVSEVGTTIILDQKATTGQIAQNATNLAKNVSYYVFPATNEYQKMSLDVIVKDYYITGSAGKYSGLFVGAFQLENPETFISLGFRGYESSIGTDSLSPYWIKNTGNAGNGSPKYVVQKDVTYNVIVEKKDDGFWAYFTNSVTGVTDKKQFKTSEMKLTLGEEVSYGIALVGAKAEIRNVKLENAKGEIIYDQNDYVSEAGTAPTVTKVTSAEVNSDRTAINLAWLGEGATGDGRYVVEVSKDGANYIKVAETKESSFSYEITGSGAYQFSIYGICAEQTTEPVKSDKVIYKAPITAPINVKTSNAEEVLTITWEEVKEADSYEVYRSVLKNGEFKKVGSTKETTFVDMSFDLEQPYYYYIISIGDDNSSNPSEKVFIMASNGHTGEYVYGKEAPSIQITKKSNDTVSNSKIMLAGNVDTAASVSLELNGTVVGESNKDFIFDITLKEGRNEVVLIVKAEDGRATRKVFNFVYLTAYDAVVDASFTGINGDLVEGISTYKTVEAAINAADETGTVIFVKNGRYYEKLTINKKNISLIGEDSEKTVLYYDVASGSKKEDGTTYGTSGSASVTINGSAQGFSAENLTISNEFDYVNENIDGKQAVALYNNSNESIFTNVRLLGYQDTLCANQNSQYYYKCYIAGNVDYIFGGAKAVFEDCDIVSLLPGYVTAASTEAAQEYGYVFINSRILGVDGLAANTVSLARPWRENAAVTYVNCYLEDVIRVEGYSNMSNNNYKNARFSEYGSYGPGFAINQDRIQLSKEEVELYNKANIFSGFDVAAKFEIISKAYTSNGVSPQPTSIPTVTPRPTNVPVKPTDAPTVEAGESIVIDLSLGVNGNASWSELTKRVQDKLDQLNSKESENQLVINLNMNKETKISKELLDVIQDENVIVNLELSNGILWSINGKDVNEVFYQGVDLAVNLNTSIVPGKVINELLRDDSKLQTSQISLAHEGDFGFKAKLTLNLNKLNQEVNNSDKMVAGIYYYDEKLQSLVLASASKINEDKVVHFNFTHASDYVVVINDKLIVDDNTLNSITVNGVKENELAKRWKYVGGTKGNKEKLEVVLTEGLQDAVDKKVISYKETYTTNNRKVAIVSKDGIATAKAPGVALINATISIGEHTFKNTTKITVKKAFITFKQSQSKITLGEKTIFAVDVYGYNKKDIVWSTNIKDRAIVWKNSGKTTAVVTGKTAGKDSIQVSVKDVKGNKVTKSVPVTVVAK